MNIKKDERKEPRDTASELKVFDIKSLSKRADRRKAGGIKGRIKAKDN